MNLHGRENTVFKLTMQSLPRYVLSFTSFTQEQLSYLRDSPSFLFILFFQGLARFPQDLYDVEPAEHASGPAQALLIRSHKLQESEVDVACRAIARCGAGTNK